MTQNQSKLPPGVCVLMYDLYVLDNDEHTNTEKKILTLFGQIMTIVGELDYDYVDVSRIAYRNGNLALPEKFGGLDVDRRVTLTLENHHAEGLLAYLKSKAHE